MDNKICFINKVLFYGIVLSGIIYIILSKNYTFIPSVYIPSIVVYLLLSWFFKIKKIEVNYLIYVNVALWLNLIGEYYFYYHSVYYDKFLHYAVPIMITIIIYHYFEINSKNMPKKELVFLAVLGLSASFEIFEYFQSGIFNFPSVGVYNETDLIMPPYQDTIWDMLCASFGILTYLIFKKIKELRYKR